MPRKGGTGDLMRPWLEKHLDETSFKEVYWLDPDDRTLVHIPWPNLGTPGGIESEKTALFKAWAQHKDHKGQDDLSKMKHSFASAIRSCEPEITELTPRTKDEKDPHRVYRINRNQGVERRRAADEAVKQSSITPPPAKVPKRCHGDAVYLPTTVEHATIIGDGYPEKDDKNEFLAWLQLPGSFDHTSITRFDPQQPMVTMHDPQALQPLLSEQAISPHHGPHTCTPLTPQPNTFPDVPPNVDIPMDKIIDDVISMENDPTLPLHSAAAIPNAVEHMSSTNTETHGTPTHTATRPGTEDNQMVIEVKYFGITVDMKTINNTLGCHIAADIERHDVSVDESNEDDDGLHEIMYGPADADQMLLPRPKCAKEDQNIQINKRLDKVIGSRGIMIYCMEGNIHVKRLSKGHNVYHECPNCPADLPVRIERTDDGQLTTVFDFKGFMDKLKTGRGKRPIAEAAIIFGKARPHWNGASPVPLVVIVKSSRAAAELLSKQDGCESSDSCQLSNSDVFDNLADSVQHISLTNKTDSTY